MNVPDFLELVRHRESCRDYQETPVPEATLLRCLEALRLAPSACNQQPWRTVVVRDPLRRQRLCREALLPGISMPWLAKAPVLLALAAERKTVTHVLAPLFSGVRYDLLDPGIAGEHFVLAAAAEGLGSCWIGWIKPGKVREIVGFPRNFQVLALISLGYPASRRDRTQRRNLDEICHFEQW